MSTLDSPRGLSSKAKRAMLRRALQRKLTRREAPVSHGQRALWLLHKISRDSVAYNLPFAVRIRSPLDVTELRRSLQALVDRHDELRTTFAEKNDEPVRIIHNHQRLSLESRDVSALAEDVVRSLISDEAYRPFDLETGPLFRGTVFSRAEDDHVLLVVTHHIINDFWSLVVMMADLQKIYGKGTEATLPAAVVEYDDYVRWETDFLGGPDGDRLWEYWGQELAGRLPLLNLATDHPFCAASNDAGSIVTFELDDDLSIALRELAKSQGTTLFVVLLSAFQVLLHRYSAQDDVLVGSPAACRGRREFEELVGYLTNMVVFRGNLSENPKFCDFLQQMRGKVLRGLEHQEFPFSLLVERLQPERASGRAPIFQAAFLMERSHRTEARGAASLMMGQASSRLRLGDLMLEEYGLEAQATPFEIALIVEDAPGRLTGCFQYSRTLFEPATIRRVTANFQHLLQSIVNDCEQKIDALDLLHGSEHSRLLVEFNDTSRDTRPQTLHDRIAEQAAKTPDAVAVEAGSSRWTYRELDRQANQLAHYLREIGVGPDKLVGVCVERSPRMVVALLGVLRAGGAYLPLDPAFPPQRVAFMLEDSQPVALLTESTLDIDLPVEASSATRIVLLDSLETELARRPTDSLDVRVLGEHLAYVIYTSGSTGRPKGVQIEHAAIANFLHSMELQPGLGASDVLLAVTTLSFDICALELFLPLWVGARLVLANRETASDASLLARTLKKCQATVMQATPATWHMLVNANQTIPPGLKKLVGGEALDPDLARRLLATSGELWNLYGPTETTVWSTLCEISEGFDHITVGKPVDNTQVYILDRNFAPCPIGVVGELYIAGEGLARGYLDRANLTAERFVPNLFSRVPGSRMYRTGDLARWLSDGSIDFLGRIDHQVKIRGFRIELGEVESALNEVEGVHRAVVVAHPQPGGQSTLVAYVVPGAEESVDTASLREQLRRRLPDYMVPSLFLLLENLPLTPNGKVDRSGLPEPPANREDIDRPFVPPETPTQCILAEIWAEVLGLDKVGIHDDFFELGGHSLLATQIASRVRARLDVHLPLHELFVEPTIASLSAAVDRRLGSSDTVQLARLPRIVRIERDQELPLSFAQERLWFLDQLQPQSPLYNIPGAVRVRGSLDLDVLRAAVATLVQRHESLRTVFKSTDGRPHQQILDNLSLQLPVDDLSTRDELPEQEIEQLIRFEVRRPFSLDTAPLFRVRLLRLSSDDHIIILTIHHILSDGWSMGIFLRELAHIYNDLQHGDSPALPANELQYADFAAWQRNYLSGEVLDKQLDYWKNELQGASSELNLASDRPRPEIPSHEGAQLPLSLSDELAVDLGRLCQRYDCTLFMALLTGFQALLCRLTGQSEVCIGTPIAGRNHPDTEDVFGLFVNTIVLRSRIADQMTFADLLKQTRHAALQAHERQDVAFEQLVDHLRIERNLARNPLFQAMFVLQNAPIDTIDIEGLTFTLLSVDPGTAKFDLTLSLEETDSGIRGFIEYSTDLFNSSTIERLADTYVRTLHALVNNPDASILQTDLLGAQQRHRVLYEFNRTEADYGERTTLTDLFERQVEECPEAEAVGFKGRWLSYGELDEWSNRVAHGLRGEGACVGRVVGVLMERSAARVAALYGCLKAGAAYLPLEVDLPGERLEQILGQAGPVAVVCDRDSVGLVPAGYPVVVADEASLAEFPRGRLASGPGPDDLAYVIYTSGSTGQPKGVQIEHGAIVNRLRWMQSEYGLTAADVVLQKTPYSFDVSVWEFFWPLLAGSRLCVAPEGVHRDPEQLAEVIQSEGVTCCHFVPSMLEPFVQAAGAGRCRSLRQVIASGEGLPYDLTERFFEILPQCKLANLYGPTEASVDVTSWQCLVEDSRRIVPIGSPIGNMACYVLDRHLKAAPIGTPGELYLAGVGLARGYLGRADLSAERFVPSPFGDGERMYKTGDLARWLGDGTLEHLGRLDGQVKIRGNRIELGEIEAALRSFEEVGEAACAAMELEGSLSLCAYLVAASGAELGSVESLRARLAQRLPSYMVPSFFTELDALPLTTSGKTDRKRLPRPSGGDRPKLEQEYVSPEGEGEIALARIFQEVLHVDRVGALDNYFALGGDSIRSIQVLARARSEGLHFSLPELFAQPTVRELAELSLQHGVEEPLAPLGALELLSEEDRERLPGDVVDAYPLIELQAGMLFHGAYSPETAVYHDVFGCRIHAPLKEEALRGALATLAGRHEALRTRFALSGFSRPLQLVSGEGELPLLVHDLTDLDEAGRREALGRFTEEEKQHRFDWNEAPLARVHVHRLTEASFYLTLSFHHAILDGWSVATLLSELFTLYTSSAAGSSGSLGPVPRLAYRDFVALEQASLEDEETQEYWREQVGQITATDLPADGELAPAEAAGSLATEARELSGELVEGLERLARQQGVPLKTLLLAVHLRCLGLVTGQGHVTTGLVTNGRPEAEDGERLLGLFLNTLPVSATLDGSWSELIQATLRAEQELLPRRRLPLARVQQLARGANLFSTAFNYNHFHIYDQLERLDALSIDEPTVFEYTNFPLMANFERQSDGRRRGLNLRLNYDSARWTGRTMSELAETYVRALESLVAEPSGSIDEGDLLGAQQRHRVLYEFNRTEADYGERTTLTDLFERQVEECPEAEAVGFKGRWLSYGELDEWSNRVAHGLRGEGACVGRVVGVLMERSAARVAALYGCLKAGAAYLPLEVDLPGERLEQILGQAGPVAVVCDRDSVGLVPAGYPVVVADEASLAEFPRGRLASGPGPDDLAYVIYTSGSTGQPKGVQIEHGAIVNRLRWMQSEYGLTAADVVLQKTPYSFDVSVWEFFWPLLAGSRLCVAPEGVHRDPEQLAEVIQSEGVTCCHFVPSMLEPFVQAAGAGRCRSLRQVIASGEGLPYDLTERFFEILPQCKLANLYGPTEASVDVTSWQCLVEDSRRIVPIGSPIGNMACYVLDRHLKAAPIGTPGELYLAGVGLARGYLGRADLSAERFVPSPFGDGERMYKTGDLARWLGDGTLEHLGRLDGQVKIRGNRIELGEIEAALRSFEEVGEAACAAMELEGSLSLCAYLVAASGAELGSVESLRARLAQRLPSYMVPSFFTELDALPLTTSGKTDRKRLPRPSGGDRPKLEQEYVSPEGEGEIALARIFQEVLHVDRVGALDNYFALGGDSIRSIQVLARARSEGLHFSLPELFAQPTVRELAELSLQHGVEEPLAPLGALELLSEEDRERLPGDVVDAYPLIELQAGMLFHGAYSPETAVYHDVFGCRIHAPLKEEALRGALATLAGRHEALRTRFALSGFSRPLQLVSGEGELPLLVHDLTDLDEAGRREALGRFTEEEKQHRFDWNEAPLARVHVHRLTEASFYLTLSFHHAILDGWSVATLLSELFTLYTSSAAGSSGSLGPVPRLAYRDFVALEQASLEDEETQEYWREQVGQITATDLPADGELAPAEAAGSLATEARELSGELVEGLERLARQQGVPLKTLLLAVHLRCLGLVTGQGHVTTGLVTNGRPEAEDGERLLGLFLNTLPVSATLDGSWSELIQATLRAEQELLPRRRLPLARVQQLARGANLFSTAFNYNHFHIYDQLERLDALSIDEPTVFEYTNFPLMANFERQSDGRRRGLNLRLNYDSARWTGRTMSELAETYVRALESLVAEPSGSIDEGDLLGAQQRHRVLYEFNRTEADYGERTTLTDLFERQVEECPEAEAVGFKGRWLSYGELDEWSNRVAHGLRGEGACVGRVVGVLMERSAARVAALYGCLKAGAAYLPLEVDLPGERLEQILGQAGPVAVVCDRDSVGLVPAGYPVVVADEASLAEFPRGRLASGPGPDDLAYVIYTSGSTGQPKGVQIEHGAIVNRLRWMQSEYGLTAADVVLQKTPYSFDVSVWEFFWPLLAGSRLCVAPEGVHRDPEQLAEVIQSEGVTCCHFVPSMLEPFVQAAGAGRCRSLRQVIASGEGLPYDLTERFFEILPQCKLANLYGPTEASVDVTSWQCLVEDSRRIVPIGSPIGNMACYVLDRHLKAAPIGTPGELYLAGVGLARGYLGRADLSAERFVPSPFGDGERMYKTGDLARWLGDGTLEHLGRLDGQVKIRGNRIELGEIEAALRSFEEVGEAACAAMELEGSLSLCAYLVAASGAELGSVESLRARLAQRLPSYMVPSFFTELDALPLTTSGKTDRKRLPRPSGGDRPKLEQEYVSPEGEGEIALARIFQEVLHVDRVGALDNYFALGGDSIRSIQVLARARSEGLHFSLPELFAQPTVRELAELSLQHGVEEPLAPLGALELLSEEDRERLPGDVVDAYPLIELQAGMLFHGAYSPETAVYHDVFGCRIHAPLKEEALRGALATLAGRHEALRTRFALSGFSRPLQLVSGEGELPLLVHDLTDLDEAGRREALGRFTEEEKQHRFDWNEAPLARVHVHRLTEASFYLTLSFHHAILDGWSVATLLSELFTLYTSSAAGSSGSLGPVPRLAYRDFVALEQASLEDEETQEYWREQVGQITATDLPADGELAPAEAAGSLATEARELSGELVEGLERLARQQGVPLKTLLLAVHLRCLGLVTGQGHVTTGLVTNGRPEAEDGERLLGLFLNTLPVSATLDGSWSELIQATLRAEQELLPRRRLPWRESSNWPGGRICSRRPSTTTTSISTINWSGSTRCRSTSRRCLNTPTSR